MDYQIIRSARRTLAIEVTADCRVVVRAPQRCPEAEIGRFVASREGWIEEKLALQRRRLERYPPPDEGEAAALRERARREIPPRVEKYAGIMGLSYAGITITGARRRFGSCSSKGRLCFSYLLMRYPGEAIDYVVVHELAHLVYMDHGPRFYALVASVLSDYRERAKLLK